MKINLQGKNIELTDQIKDYVLKRVTNLEKLLQGSEDVQSEAVVVFEVGKNTQHHKAGDVFHADCYVDINGDRFYSSADEEDLYTAVDKVRESLFKEISRNKGRKQTLFKRGAMSVKKMMKGLSKRNPFTSKYDKED
ncbi:MAG: ribosome-associated translation inhibitor RaiA [Candidatus Pacebacteria bacterium]|nr:ribosome-associated translation inhibitor RaiA [Candidatus Paceibacterota bacterium]MCF7862823.1 ribosome-associated translation inhibitor RaiA [Candidatus Paceibacterota bacterium]